MGKIAGKIAKFYYGTKGAGWTTASLYAFISAEYDSTFAQIDVTDTGDTDDTEEVVLSRAARSMKIDANLLDNTGADVTGKNMTLTYNAVTVNVTDADYTEAYTVVDTTDSATTGDGDESSPTLAKRTSKIVGWVLAEALELVENTVQACVVTFATGVTLTGNAFISATKITGNVKDFQKVEYTLIWQPGLVKVLPKCLPMITSSDFEILYEKGTTTDKAYVGTGIITDLSITANIKSGCKVSNTMRINGAVTKTIYS